MERRKLKLKAKLESISPDFSFKRLVPGAFNVGVAGSTCKQLLKADSHVLVSSA